VNRDKRQRKAGEEAYDWTEWQRTESEGAGDGQVMGSDESIKELVTRLGFGSDLAEQTAREYAVNEQPTGG
jgi:hypothetical protein